MLIALEGTMHSLLRFISPTLEMFQSSAEALGTGELQTSLISSTLTSLCFPSDLIRNVARSSKWGTPWGFHGKRMVTLFPYWEIPSVLIRRVSISGVIPEHPWAMPPH